MGLVESGSISGYLPSKKGFAVHYPGYPSSVERSVETLGGIEGIIKARGSQSNKLELHFRPEDPYSHPAFGERRCCHNYLLKISKCEGGPSQAREPGVNLLESPKTAEFDNHSEPESITTTANAEWRSSEAEEKLFADIVVQMPDAYNFTGMVDYQHVVAVHADAARKRKKNWADVEPQFGKRGLIDVDQEDLMILVPPLFSPKDIPEKLVLKPSAEISLKKRQEGVIEHCWEMDIEPCLAIDFNVKAVPKKVNWEKFIPQGSDQWEWQTVVCKLFDERPIWSKYALAECLANQGLSFGANVLRRLLFRAAYYYSNGPFLRFWIRKGYDPREDPESRVFQRTDFRVPPSLRSYCETNFGSGLKHRWEDLCTFRVFPYKCQTSLQLFELVDDFIQQEIKKPPTQRTCSLATGWFTSCVIDSMRLRVAVRFLSVYPHPGAESLLKSASVRFEKSRRAQFFTEEPKLNEGQQEVDKDHGLVKKKQMNEDENEEDEDVDDDEDEDEIMDDNMEDELEAYEAGEESDFVLPSSYNHQDSISKNYLQELFDSFPFSGAGDAFPTAEDSDGEYQIYEQYSDDNYSDDH